MYCSPTTKRQGIEPRYSYRQVPSHDQLPPYAPNRETTNPDEARNETGNPLYEMCRGNLG